MTTTTTPSPNVVLEAAALTRIKQAFRNPKTVLLDACTDNEIIRDGFLSVKAHRWVHALCTKEDCPLLEKMVESQLPNKNGMSSAK